MDGRICRQFNGLRSELGHLHSWSIFFVVGLISADFIKGLRHIRMGLVFSHKFPGIWQIFIDSKGYRKKVQDGENVYVTQRPDEESVYFD